MSDSAKKIQEIQPSRSQQRLFQWIDAYVAVRSLLDDPDSMPASARACLRLIMQDFEKLFKILEAYDGVKSMLQQRLESIERQGYIKTDQILTEQLKTNYGIDSADYYTWKKWRKKDYMNYVKFRDPLFGDPLMEDPGDSFKLWNKETAELKNDFKEEKYRYVLFAMKQVKSGQRALLAPGNRMPIKLTDSNCLCLEHLMINAKLNVELKGTVRIPDYEFASEIWVDGVPVTLELLSDKQKEG